MTFSVAFFLSPSGDLIYVPDNHIGVVIRDPQRFGLTGQAIETAYLRHGETVGVEGVAREEILLKVVSRGWIRLRRYPNRYWSITAPFLTPAVQEHMRDWAMRILAGIEGFKEPDRHMPVRVSSLEGEFHSTIGDLAEGSCPW